MRVFAIDNPGNPATVEGFFQGTARLERLEVDPGAIARTSRVTFESGARTVWHSHVGGQFLVFLSGEGVVATRDQTHRAGPGDVVWTDTGEEHWHGAANAHSTSHVAISFGDTRWRDQA